MYIERRTVFRSLSTDLGLGSLLLVLGIALVVGIAVTKRILTPDLQFAGQIIAFLLIWIAGFALFFGRAAAKAGYFPLLFLLLMVPPPNFLFHRFIYLLQAGSADITRDLFDIFGVPALRE